MAFPVDSSISERSLNDFRGVEASWAGLKCSRLGPVCAAGDALAIVAASLVGHGAYHAIAYGIFFDVEPSVGLGVLAAVLYVLSANAAGLYTARAILGQRVEKRDIMARWLAAFLLVVLAAFLLKIGDTLSRGAVSTFGLMGLGALLLWRTTAKHVVRRTFKAGRLLGRKAVLVGTTDELAYWTRADLLVSYGSSELARYDVGSRGGQIDDMLRTVIDRAREMKAEQIVLALPWDNQQALETARSSLRALPLPVQLLPAKSVRSMVSFPGHRLSHSLAIEIQRAPLSGLERAWKRIFDIAFAAFFVVLLLPLLVIVAVAIKLESRGPVIFRQKRRGFNGEPFTIYKFRSMNVLEDGPTIRQAQKDDCRVTRVGRFLRQSSIDELPQLFNVLRGEMSLIGPRPHAVAHDDAYGKIISDYAFRHHVKPGISGWAQVNRYRGETAQVEQMAKRIEHDLWYINNWSLGLDFRILARTFFELAGSHNAY